MSSESTSGSTRFNRFNSRPVNLALWTMRFPITAIISIFHRITGFFLFLLIPIVLYFWQLSLSNEENFNLIKNNLEFWYVKFFVWATIVAVIYHMIAGIRHLFMDLHIGDSKKAGKVTSCVVLILTAVLSVLLGVYLW